MKLYIDDIYIGYVKEYHQNLNHKSWIFVLDTIDSASEKYQLQVEINFAAIRCFNSGGELRITTWEGVK